jgi:hypothetical protein
MFKNKTTYSFILFLTAFISVGNAQQVYIEAGVENAYFKNYVNNLGGNTLDLNYAKSEDLFLESGLRANFFTDRFQGEVGASYNKYIINTGFYVGNNPQSIPLRYNLTYIGVKTGLNFAVLNDALFKIKVHANISFDYLTKATSAYQKVVNDLIADNTYDRTLLRYHRGLSAEYFISDNLSTYIKYNIADSFIEKNQDSNIGEQYSLHTNAFSFGLLFSINGSNNRCYGSF